MLRICAMKQVFRENSRKKAIFRKQSKNRLLALRAR